MGDIWPYGPPRYVSFADTMTAAHGAGFSIDGARVMAAIGTAESGRDLTVVNDTPATGDYSVGIWQINYYGSLWAGRKREFGRPGHLVRSGVNGQAHAAYVIWQQQGLEAWSTYKSGAYIKYLNGSTPPGTPIGSPQQTPSPPDPTTADDWSHHVVITAAKFAVGSDAFDRHARTLKSLIR